MGRAPALPTSFTEGGWRQVRTQTKEELTLPAFSIRSHSRLYEHVETAEALQVVSGADLDMPPRAVFTTVLEFAPSFADVGVEPDAGPVFAVARRQARNEFARSVREDGLVSVERTDARWLDRDDGTSARAFRYDVTFPLSPEAVDGDSRQPTLRGVLWAAIWPTDRTYAMAGGIYPAESLDAALDRQGATLALDTDGRIDDGAGPTVDVDRATHRQMLTRAIRSAGLVG